MDELDTARGISMGRLTSPQSLGSLTLYAMRVSGTGVSYRRGIDEFVWRDPALYLSQNMIERCAGLPVIWEHPKSTTLNSDEFADRVIGAIMFAYIKGDELWCIARVYDETAIKAMSEDQLSTSPAVVFRDPTVNKKVELDDGAVLLIEGKPSLLDHLAICGIGEDGAIAGVWDKAGPLTGVQSDSLITPGSVIKKDNVMTMEDEKKADAAKAAADADERKEKEREEEKRMDAEAGTKIDKILAHLDSLSSRMDAFDAKADAAAEKAKADWDEEEKKKEEKKADKSKKDWDEDEDKKKSEKKADKDEDEEEWEKDEPKKVSADKSKSKKDTENPAEEHKSSDHRNEEKVCADSARADADAAMRKKIADLESAISDTRSRMPMQLSDADYAKMAKVQADADQVYTAFGLSASPPMSGETVIAYRRRLAAHLQQHSEKWKDVSLLLEPKAFAIAEETIYADAMTAAAHPIDIGAGILREVRRRNLDTGHMIKEYFGSPSSWMSQFSGGKRLARFNLNNGDRR